MKTHLTFLALAVVMSAASFAQGPLVPSGAPGPTMKALDQVEPRTPITNLPFTIAAPGSYYLTGSLTGTASSAGIIIDADRVTIDLMGYTLLGSSNTLDGIRVLNARNSITVRNGAVTGWGQDGVDLVHGGNGDGGLIENVHAGANNSIGIRANDNAVVANCTAHGNGGSGITAGQSAVIRSSTARENAGAGISGSINNLIEGNTSQGNGGNGISGGTGSTVAGNAVRANTGNGIFASSGSRVNGNTVTTNGGSGIFVQSLSVVRDNTVDANGTPSTTAAGISASLGHNRIENNTVTRNNIGLRVTDSDNVVKDNIVKLSQAGNYEFGVRNQLDLLLSEIPETISWPAMVRLAGSLTGRSGTNGITVLSSDVTIDLGGNTMSGPGELTGYGVYLAPTYRNLTVRNGTIRSFREAIRIHNARNGRLENLVLTENVLFGLFLYGNGGVSSGHLVVDCIINNNSSHGVVMEVTTGGECNANRILRTTINGNGGEGIYMRSAGGAPVNYNRIEQCTITANNRGIWLLSTGGGDVSGNVISDCIVSGNLDAGIDIFGQGGRAEANTVREINAHRNYVYGIHLRGAAANRVERNHVVSTRFLNDNPASSSYGILAVSSEGFSSSNNFVVQNFSANHGSLDNYFLGNTGMYGPMVSNIVTEAGFPVTGAPAHPWANFTPGQP